LRDLGRGGESPRSLGSEEGEAAEGDRDVVMPAAEAASFKVIEAELALEVLIYAFGSPALLDQLNELHERHSLIGGEVEVARLVVVIAPFADEPYTIAAARFVTVLSRWDDA